VGRQGGDEFLHLLLEIKNSADAANAVCQIIESIARPCEFDGLKVIVKSGIGIAFYPEDGKSAMVLIKNADSAMYRAKRSDKVYRFHPSRNAP
jgi:diguanylate cyclase (GGDEF)-like protein